MALPVGESDNDESYDLVEQLAAARESLFRRSGAGDRSSNNTLSGRVYRAPRLRRVRSGRTIGSDDEEEDLEMRLRRDRERAHKKRRQRQRDELAGKAGETAVKDPAVVKDSWMDWREVPRTLHHRQTTSHRRREKKIACL